MLMIVVPRLRYGLRMRAVSKMILVLAGVSFLSITLSGFHLHADAATHDEKAPHQHVHSYAGSPELDEDHIDVCLFEPATEYSKGEVVAFFYTLTRFKPDTQTDNPSPADRQDPLPTRHLRWRPLLRGPPYSV